MLRKLGLVIRDEFFFDIPPWTAIDFSKIFPGIRMYSTRGIAGSDNRAIDNVMRKYAFIEKSSLPRFLKGLLAHHVAIIAEKSDGGS